MSTVLFDVPRIVVWLSAEREAQRRGLSLSDEVALDTWHNEAGFGHEATQATAAARPMLRHDGTRWIVEFDGTDDHMDIAGDALKMFRAVGGITAVAGVRSTTTNRQDVLTVRTPTEVNVGQILSRNRNLAGSVEFSGRRLSGNAFVTVQSAAAQFASDEWGTQSGRMDFANQVAKVRLDGVDLQTVDPFSTAGNTENADIAGISIGAEHPSTGAVWFLDGAVTDVFLVNAALDDATLVGLEDWVAATIAGSIPAPSPIDPTVPEQRGADGLWSFNRPRAVHHLGSHDRTYWAATTSDGALVVHSLDHGTGEVARGAIALGLQADAHNSPVMRVRADGRIQVFVSGHNLPLKVFTSVNAEDVGEWDAGQQLAANATYPEVLTLSDRVVVHYRNGTFGSWSRHYRESVDDGNTWGAAVEVVSAAGQRPYMHVAKHPTSDRIDYLVNSGHLNETTASLYHFYQIGGQFFRSDGTLIGALVDLPLLPSDGTVVWDAVAEGVEALGWDIRFDRDGLPHAAFITVPGTTGHIARYARWDGAAWQVSQIGAAGGTIIPGGGATEAHVSAGVQLDPDDDTRAWLSVESGGGEIAELYEASTNDRGSTWALTKRTESAKHFYPMVPQDRHADFAVLFLSGGVFVGDATDAVVMSLGITEESSVDSSEPAPEPNASFLVQSECSSCLLAIGDYPTLTVRFQIAAADDPTFSAPVVDTGFYAGDGSLDDGSVYHIAEGLAPGHYLARIHAQTIFEDDAISPDMPFTILDLSAIFLGGWRSGV